MVESWGCECEREGGERLWLEHDEQRDVADGDGGRERERERDGELHGGGERGGDAADGDADGGGADGIDANSVGAECDGQAFGHLCDSPLRRALDDGPFLADEGLVRCH